MINDYKDNNIDIIKKNEDDSYIGIWEGINIIKNEMKISEDEISILNTCFDKQNNDLLEIHTKENDMFQKLSSFPQFKNIEELKNLTNCVLELRTKHRIEKEILDNRQKKLLK